MKNWYLHKSLSRIGANHGNAAQNLLAMRANEAAHRYATYIEQAYDECRSTLVLYVCAAIYVTLASNFLHKIVTFLSFSVCQTPLNRGKKSAENNGYDRVLRWSRLQWNNMHAYAHTNIKDVCKYYFLRSIVSPDLEYYFFDYISQQQHSQFIVDKNV